jgi:hypothetical protein
MLVVKLLVILVGFCVFSNQTTTTVTTADSGVTTANSGVNTADSGESQSFSNDIIPHRWNVIKKRTGKLTQTLLDNKGNKFIRRKVRKNIIYLNCNVPSCSAKAQAFSEDPANMELEPTIMQLDREHLLCDGSGTAHAPEPGAYHDYFDRK